MWIVNCWLINLFVIDIVGGRFISWKEFLGLYDVFCDDLCEWIY